MSRRTKKDKKDKEEKEDNNDKEYTALTNTIMPVIPKQPGAIAVHAKQKMSVCQILATYAIHDINFPFMDPFIESATGSGFVVGVIDEKTVLVMTNAHVVANSTVLQAKFPGTGETLHTCKVRVFCNYRDLATVEVSMTTGICPPPLKFTENSLTLLQSEQVYVIGHPLGERSPQITQGHVSGFSKSVTAEEYMSYIQTSTPINPGNSGGPILNTKGEVVGICAAGIMFAQNIGYCIPSNSALGVLHAELPNTGTMMYRPLLGLGVNRRVTGDGLYIHSVYPDSIFAAEDYVDTEESRLITFAEVHQILPKVEENVMAGDILKGIDITTAGKNAIKLNLTLGVDGTANLPEYDRILTIVDIEPLINIGSEVSLHIERNGKKMVVTSHFLPHPVAYWMSRNVFPTLAEEKPRFKWLILGGLVLMENQVTAYEENEENDGNTILSENAMKRMKRFLRRIIVCNVLAGGMLQELGVRKRDCLTHVNGNQVFILDDIPKNTKELVLQFDNYTTFIVDTEKAKVSDAVVLKRYKAT
jgi:S1-C subfamily serine protease